jgi:hypothetical protein
MHLLLSAWALVVLVWQVQVSLCTSSCKNNHTDHTTRTAVPLDGLRQRTLDELDALLFSHLLPPVCVAVSVDVCRPRTADRVRLLVQGASEWDRVDLTTMLVVPASDDETGPERLSAIFYTDMPRNSRERVLVRIAELLEDGRRGLCRWCLVVGGAVHLQVVLYDVSDSLCVRRRARSTAPDCVVDLCELVGDSVCDVGAGGRPAVCR